MPRSARKDHPGALHHVMVRGVERREIFLDDRDRARFLVRLEETLLPAGLRCHAWALMPNHVHLLLRTGGTPLAVAMHRLGTCHAMDFNRRHDRVGHLFQNRYKALPVRDDAYLLQVARYIHLNPVRAGLVEDLDALEVHPWTGHRALMGRGPCPFLDAGFLLGMVDDDPVRARRRLREWMEEGLGSDPDARPGSDGPFRGTASPSPPPPCAGPSTSAGHEETPRRVRARILADSGWDLVTLTETVCARWGVDPWTVRSGRKSRVHAEARAVIAWLGWRDLGLNQVDLARHLGVGTTAIPGCHRRGRGLVERQAWDPFREPAAHGASSDSAVIHNPVNI